jgi:3-phosphoshikimate 1-carboxyvinyltransferase
VGLNPTRSTLLDVLASMGASIQILNVEQQNGELVGQILVKHSRIRGGVIEKETTAALIDEIPVLAVLGAASEEGLDVRDAGELRIKETDRIATIAENLRRMGIEANVSPDGIRIPGRQRFHAAELDSFGDHRIAMAFSIASLMADGSSEIHGAEAASVSFPDFYRILRQVTA